MNTDTIISDKPVTESKINTIVEFAKEYAKADACHFSEWAFREGWRQGPASYQWSNVRLGAVCMTTEYVYAKFEKRIEE